MPHFGNCWFLRLWFDFKTFEGTKGLESKGNQKTSQKNDSLILYRHILARVLGVGVLGNHAKYEKTKTQTQQTNTKGNC